jgi:hypothetical protein
MKFDFGGHVGLALRIIRLRAIQKNKAFYHIKKNH